jgi:two-component system response regulator HydG
MVSDAVTRSKGRVLSQEPFRQAISADLGRHPALPAAPVREDGPLQKKLESIWGHFPTLDEAEELLIDTALTMAKGNQGIAATMLGLKRQTLNMRLKAKEKR